MRGLRVLQIRELKNYFNNGIATVEHLRHFFIRVDLIRPPPTWI